MFDRDKILDLINLIFEMLTKLVISRFINALWLLVMYFRL